MLHKYAPNSLKDKFNLITSFIPVSNKNESPQIIDIEYKWVWA